VSEEEMPESGALVPSDEGDELSTEELAGHDGQALPEREAMSSLNLNISGVENFAMPINEASALNYNSSNSVAVADADQTVILGQVAETGGEPTAEGGSEPAAAQAEPAESGDGALEAEGQPAETGGDAPEADGAAESSSPTSEPVSSDSTSTE
jgi:hypothetical protein